MAQVAKVTEKPNGVMRLQISIFSGGRMGLQGSGNLTDQEIVFGLTSMINKIMSKQSTAQKVTEKPDFGVVPFNPRKVDQPN